MQKILTQIAPQVFLFPAGLKPSAAPEGALALPAIAGPAFGDGSHPTTRMCAGAIDLLCRQKPLSVLDVGTGTGVLARIARARGARFVAATDIDAVALESAQKHVALDAHPLEIPVLDVLPDYWGPTFDLTVANILEGPLRELAPCLARSLRPGGVLLLSGFTPRQVSGVQVAFSAHGFAFVSESTLESWSLLMFRRE